MWPPSAWAAPGAPSSHLNSVADTPELRAAYNENLPRVTEFHARLGADERLYAKYKAVMAAPGARSAEHPPEGAPCRMRCATSCCPAPSCRAKRAQRFAEMQESQAELAQQFSEHVLDATDAFVY